MMVACDGGPLIPCSHCLARLADCCQRARGNMIVVGYFSRARDHACSAHAHKMRRSSIVEKLASCQLFEHYPYQLLPHAVCTSFTATWPPCVLTLFNGLNILESMFFHSSRLWRARVESMSAHTINQARNIRGGWVQLYNTASSLQLSIKFKVVTT